MERIMLATTKILTFLLCKWGTVAGRRSTGGLLATTWAKCGVLAMPWKAVRCNDDGRGARILRMFNRVVTKLLRSVHVIGALSGCVFTEALPS